MDTQMTLSKQSRSAFLKVRAVIVAGFLLAVFASALAGRVGGSGEIRSGRFAQGR
jgi:hypothetical protein